MIEPSPKNRTPVLVDGCRVPFRRSGTDYTDLIAYDLARSVLKGLLTRSELEPSCIERVILGTVVQNAATSNVAREAALGAGLPHHVPAHTVTMACISANQAIAGAADLIRTGEAEVVIAGGTETLSDVPLQFPKELRKRLFEARKYKSPLEYRKLVAGMSPSDLLPRAPAIAEYSTGETMGESADKLAAAFGVSRREQDEYALRSHHLAAQATREGKLEGEITPAVLPPDFEPLTQDNTFRESSMEKLAALPPVFVKPFGTVTAGNSSPLTDGAAATLIMSEERALALGYTPKAYLRDYTFVAQDPGEELLLGPAYAVPKLLNRTGLTLDDIDVIEIHEAFAGQVLAVLKALESDQFAKEKLGQEHKVGKVDMDKINPWGGSLSLGHPFGATGARLVTTAAHRLFEEDARYALVTACAAGGAGARDAIGALRGGGVNGVELERDGNIAVIWLDTPGERVNKLTTGMLEDFSELLDTLENTPDIEAAVLVSRKKDSFIVGADIEAFKDFATPAEAEAVIREGHALFNRLEGLQKPVVAAIHGAAAGGGLELAMACSYRLVSTHPKTKLSLPEVNLGLLPGLGGTQRLPRLVGVQKALEIMLTGKSVYPKPARKMGLVDATIHPQGLLEAAKQAARELAKGDLETGRDTLSWRDRLLERTPLSRVVYQQAEKSVQERTGGHYPAPLKIVECVRVGQERGFEAGLEAERQGFSELLFTPQSKALIHLFFAKNAAEKNPYKTEAREVRTVGVLGAGLMGAGIAQISAAGGYDVLLKDRNLELAAAGKKKVWEGLSKRVGKGMSTFERDQTAERVVPVEAYAPFGEAEVVIEAVLEDLDLKRSVLGELEAVNDDFIFATNTSSIPVGQIAAGAAHPERVVGMHYFSPAQKIPLLEIVKTERTPDWVLGTAFAVGLKQGKTVIVVGDAPGFYTTRILAAYMNEALLLLEEGGDITQIDKAMRAFGFPVGPLTLLDEVGIDVGAKITEVMRDFFEERGVTPSRAGQEVVEAGYKGRKNKKGFYKYESGGDKEKEVNPDIYEFFGGPSRKTLPPKLIQNRLAFMMMNEAARCLEEGVIASPTDGDVGAVFGLGFPPFLGGPFWYMNARGLGEVVGTLSELEQTHGPRFKPADILREKLESGFYS